MLVFVKLLYDVLCIEILMNVVTEHEIRIPST